MSEVKIKPKKITGKARSWTLAECKALADSMSTKATESQARIFWISTAPQDYKALLNAARI